LPGAGPPIGIDVSHFQQNISWTSVAAAGINYCFIKATEGDSLRDRRFPQHWEASAGAGILRGAYHLFRPSDPVTAQADFFLRAATELPPGDLPPVLDLENPPLWRGVPPADRASLAVEWLERVEQGLSATPMVYLCSAFAAEILGNSLLMARFPVWVAEYTSAPTPSVPKPWTAWTFWQFTNRGRVPGVAEPLDLSRFNGTIEQLRALQSG